MSEATRFCTYCRHNRLESEFVDVFDKKGKRRNRKCSYCIKVGKMPAKARDERGRQLAEIRRKAEHAVHETARAAFNEKQKEKEAQKDYESKAADK